MADPVVVITGCSSGIGRQCAGWLHQEGYEVAATVRDNESRTELEALGMAVLELDLARPDSIAACAGRIIGDYGDRPLVLVNNAGYSQSGAMEDLRMEALAAQFQVNLFGVFDLIQRLVPAMRRMGEGRIVNISSSAAFMGTPYTGAYIASKTALESLSESLRHELRPSRIHVSLIIPGPIETRINENSKAVSGKGIRLEGSPHAKVYEKTLAPDHSLHKGMFGGFTTDARPVCRCLKKIIRSKRPSFRYYPTLLPRLMRTGRKMTPQPVFDRVMDLILKKYRA